MIVIPKSCSISCKGNLDYALDVARKDKRLMKLLFGGGGDVTGQRSKPGVTTITSLLQQQQYLHFFQNNSKGTRLGRLCGPSEMSITIISVDLLSSSHQDHDFLR